MVTFDQQGQMRVRTQNANWREILAECLYGRDGFPLFCKTFIDGHIEGEDNKTFSGQWTEDRLEFASNLKDQTLARVFNIMYRGGGKSTMVRAALVYMVCFRLQRFVLYTSFEEKLASQATEMVKRWLTRSPIIKEVFGDFRPARKKQDGGDDFSTKAWYAVDPVTEEPFCLFSPRGEGQTINGQLDVVGGRAQRPTLIVNDDGQDRQTIDNEDIRAAHARWWDGVVQQCVDTSYEPDPETGLWLGKSPNGHVPWRLWMFDSCKHADALIMHVAQNRQWHGKICPIATADGDGNFKSRVPYLTDAQVKSRHDSMLDKSVFWREYMCQPTAPMEDGFPAIFKYYREGDLDINGSDMFRCVIMDPARTMTAKSAYTAMLPIAIDPVNAKIYLRGLVYQRLGTEDMENILFATAKRYNAGWIAVEDEGLADHIKTPLLNGRTKRGMNVGLMWLKTTRAATGMSGDFGKGPEAIKRRRATAGMALYRPFLPTHPDGHVFHEESLRGSVLEAQMRSFPSPAHWDALDCLGHIPQVMAQRGLFFLQQEELAPGGESERTLHFREYRDRIRSGSWRMTHGAVRR